MSFLDELWEEQLDGWQLQHHGINIVKDKYHCSVCKGEEDDWWNLFYEGGHIGLKNNRHK